MKGKNKWLWSHRTLANLFVVLVGIAFYLCLSNFDLVRGKVAEIVKIFTPFIAGFALAYLLNLPMRFFDRKNNFGLQTDDFTVNLTSTMCCVRFVRIQMHCRCVFWRNADDNITENECPAFGFYLYPDDLLVPYI